MASSSLARRPSLADDLALAQRLARCGGEVALARFRDGDAARGKRTPADVVTAADLAAQAAMVEQLAAHRPWDGVLAEEGPLERAGERQWLVDPVDGTLAFHRGIPWWCTAVAVRDAEGCLLSAVFDPSAGELFSAARGAGAELDGVPVRCRPTTALDEALLHTWLDAEVAALPEFAGLLARLLPRCLALKSGGSGSQALAWLAAGRIDGYVELFPAGDCDWDWLPGQRLVESAGGVTRARGDWRMAAATAELLDALDALVLDAEPAGLR